MEDYEQHATIKDHHVTISIQATTSEHWIFLAITPTTRRSREHRNDPITNHLLARITRIVSAAFRQTVHRHQWDVTPHQNGSYHAMLALPRDDNAATTLIALLNVQGTLEDH